LQPEAFGLSQPLYRLQRRLLLLAAVTTPRARRTDV